MVGRTLQARVESRGALDGGHWLARTGDWRNVHLAAAPGRRLPFGELVAIQVTGAGPHFLRAELA